MRNAPLRVSLFIAFCSLGPACLAAGESPFADAVAAWQLADTKDSAGKSSDLTPAGGPVRLGVELKGEEREASLRRGGDGKVAEFGGGWLDAGQGRDGDLNLAGKAMTLAIRLRDPSGKWNTSLFSKHGGHNKLLYNLFTVDLGAGMFLGFEMGTDRGMVQASVPTSQIEALDAWHDVIARYDGQHVDFFIDGVLRDRRPFSGTLRNGNTEPCLLGAESTGGKGVRPFHGQVDHAALWNRALTDDEVIALSGGSQEVGDRRAKFEAREKQARANAATQHREAVARATEADAKARARADRDPNRPAYHFHAPALWMNDPNGPIFYKGEYHMFYQHNPYGEDWGHMHWGHAKSKDLVHWEHLPVAIAPSLGLGEEHCFSGCAVVRDGVPTLLYTSIGPRTPAGDAAVQWIATSNDDMLTFDKHPSNPVMTGDLHTPARIVVKDWRDPFAWQEGGTWYVVLGGHREGGKGGAYLYKSKDFLKWEFSNILFEGDEGNWECPLFFPIGDKWVLIYSPHGLVRYYTGTLGKDRKFYPEYHGTLDRSGTFYAPNALRDGSDRRLLWGWSRVKGDGWNGAFTLPRVLTVRDDGRLAMQPATELETLRGEHAKKENVDLSPGSPARIDAIRGKRLEVRAEIEPGDAEVIGLTLRRAGGAPETAITLDRSRGRLSAGGDSSEFALLKGEKALSLRVLVDGALIEVYANGRECFTLPGPSGDVESIEAFARGGEAKARVFEAWELKPSPIK